MLLIKEAKQGKDTLIDELQYLSCTISVSQNMIDKFLLISIPFLDKQIELKSMGNQVQKSQDLPKVISPKSLKQKRIDDALFYQLNTKDFKIIINEPSSQHIDVENIQTEGQQTKSDVKDQDNDLFDDIPNYSNIYRNPYVKKLSGKSGLSTDISQQDLIDQQKDNGLDKMVGITRNPKIRYSDKIKY